MPEKKGLDIETLKEIINIMKEYDLSEICIEQNGVKMQVKQGYAQPPPAEYTVPVQPVHEKPELVIEHETSKDNSVFISAPIVGTFYETPKPGEKPYVKIGDSVTAGQVICIIEAMKIMNEITADMDCDILEILVKNGQDVEYSQSIFRVRPKS